MSTLDELRPNNGNSNTFIPTPAKVEQVDNGVIKKFNPEDMAENYNSKPQVNNDNIMEGHLADIMAGIERSEAERYDNIVRPQEEARAAAILAGDDVDNQPIVAIPEDQLKPVVGTVNAAPAKVEVKQEETLESALEADIADDSKTVYTEPNPMGSIEDELEAELNEDEVDTDEVDNDQDTEDIKKVIKETIHPIKNKLDLSKFTINKKPISATMLLRSIEQHVKVADWVMYTAKKPISISALNGTELDLFNPNQVNNARNRLNVYKQMYTIIYNHVEDVNKPKTLEEWAKTIPFYDINHLYFAVYKACFSDCNIIPYVCPKCAKTSMLNVDINRMIKYSTPEIEAEVNAIFKKDTTSSSVYETEMVQISDNYAATIKMPTVYSVLFENSAIDEKFIEKYGDILNLISYIDNLYYINTEDNTLSVIEYKVDADDFVKTTKRKILTYAKILNTLNSDQYNQLVAEMRVLMTKNDGITYVQPEMECPLCHTTIPEATRDPLDLVFTRHQLVAISNI